MVEEVLRLRATVVTDDALANMRQFGREIGLIQAKGGKGAKEAAGSWAALGKQIKAVGSELASAAPALGGFGLGAAGAGIAARVLIGTLGDISKKIIEMKYASRELGLTEQALKGFATEAQKAGIAPEALMQGLGNFKRNTDDFKFRIGELRGQMVAMGAGPVLARINAATNQIDKLKEAYDFKEVLMESDPSGVKARRFFDMIGLGADAARLSWSELSDTIRTKKALSPEDIKAAEDFNKSLIALGDQWDHLKTKVGIKLFPLVAKDLEDLNKILGALGKFDEWWDSWAGKGKASDPVGGVVGALNRATGIDKWDPFGWKAQRDAEQAAKGNTGPGPRVGTPPPAATPQTTPQAPLTEQGLRDWYLKQHPNMGSPPSVPSVGRQSSLGGGGMYQPASFGGPSSGESDASRIIKIGVFDALVDFKSYVETGQVSGGGATGMGGGIIKASLGGGDGGFTGGGTGAGGGLRSGGGFTMMPDDGGSGGSGHGAPNGSSIPRPEGGPSGGGGAPSGASTPGVGAARGRVAKGGDPRGMEAHIRETAAKYGIDPDTAVAVAKSEGLSTFQSSVKRSGKGSFQGREDSWGAFQLYMGGGLGNAFQKETGLDPRDPANEKATIDYALKHASKSGWGSWYGARNTGIGNMAGIGGRAGVGAARGKVASLEPGVQPDGQATPVPASPGGGAVEEAQERVAGIRKGKLDAQLREALEYSAEASGLKVRVTSGGQRMHGAHGATGSHRHDKGRAADIDLIDPKTGKILDRSDPRRLKFLEESAAAGAGGTGAGYMSDRRKIHVGTTGSAAIVGQGLGAYAGSPEERAAVGRGLNRMMTPQQVAEARQRQIAARDATKRIDTAVAPPAASGNVNVTVNSNGTKAQAEAKTDGDLFQPPTVKQHKQMQRTEDAGETISI